jgi:hypothetical protein
LKLNIFRLASLPALRSLSFFYKQPSLNFLPRAPSAEKSLSGTREATLSSL